MNVRPLACVAILVASVAGMAVAAPNPPHR